MTTTCDGQNEEPSKRPSDFSDINVKVLKLRLNGSEFVYSAKVFVPEPGARPVPVNIPRTAKFTIMVPHVKEVDGKKVTMMKPEVRDRIVMITEMKQGSYKMKTVSVGSDVQYFSIAGKKMSKDEAIRQVGMKDFYAILLPQYKKIPGTWQAVFNPDTIVIKYKEPLKGQNAVASFPR